MEMIIDRLADELGEEDAVLLEQHIAECRACAAEERRLGRLLQASVPREEWPEDSGLENRLASALQGLAAAAPVSAAINAKRLPVPHRIVHWLRHFLKPVGRPVPAYAVLSLTLVGITAGFWIGQASIPDNMAGLNQGPAWVVPNDLPQGDTRGGRPETQRGGAEQHFAQATLAYWPIDSVTQFAQTPRDAISLAVAFQPDSL
jgi:hypothetical protein